MYRSGRWLRKLFFGNDEKHFYLRLDLLREDALTVAVHFHRPAGYRVLSGLPGRGTHEFSVTAPDGARRPRSGVARGEIVDLAIALADLGVVPGDPLSFQVRLSQGGVERECCPEKIPIEFTLVSEEFALRNWIV